jgi:hypothetical protein
VIDKQLGLNGDESPLEKEGGVPDEATKQLFTKIEGAQ